MSTWPDARGCILRSIDMFKALLFLDFETLKEAAPHSNGVSVLPPLGIPEHQVAYWNEHSEGGHFAAMEAPELLVDDLRDFLRSLG